MLGYLLQGLLLGFPAAAQPGSMQAYLLAQTLKNGWRRTLPLAFAPLISDLPIVLLMLLLLTYTPPLFLSLLQIVGGLFLLYLAWGAWKGMQTAVSTPPPPDSAQKGLFKAALLNALNPNPYIFWATIAGPILLTALRESVWHGLAFLFGFYATLIGGFAAFVGLFSLTGRLSPHANRWLAGAAALALGLFGLYQLWKGFSGLIY